MAQNVLILDDTMTAIADAIRETTGTQDKMLPRDMPDAIKAGGGSTSDLIALVEGTLTELKIPEGTTSILPHFLEDYGKYIKTESRAKLQKVVIPNSVTTVNNIAFSGSGLEVLICGYWLRTIKASAFQHCLGLVHSYLREQIQTIEDYAFEDHAEPYWSSLLYEGTQSKFESSVNNASSARVQFYECSFLKNSNDWIVTKDTKARQAYTSATAHALQIRTKGPGVVAYMGMDAEVTVPDTEGKILHSGSLAGRRCLTDVTISAGIKTVYSRIIYGSQNVKTVRFLGTPTEIAEIAFETRPTYNDQGAPALKDIYVPWSEGDVEGAPWGAPDTVQIHYNS